MSEPKNQHIIPQCYLKQFIDPNTPAKYEPYVWIFTKGEKIGKKKAPKNILAETDIYTIKTKVGKNDYTIEKTLAQLEGEYSSIFETKIKAMHSLSDYEHIVLCAFVATMLQRTLKQKENIEEFMDKIINMTEEMEKAHGMEAKKSIELKKEKENAHKISVLQMLPHITEILLQMNIAFLCAKKTDSFITSDSPCYLFNHKLQWQRFYGIGLAQKYTEVHMPLSTKVSVCFSWVNNLRGYIEADTDLVHESNRMIYGYSYKYFIANSPNIKRRWFRRFPLDPIFIIRIFKNRTWPQIKYFLSKIKNYAGRSRA